MLPRSVCQTSVIRSEVGLLRLLHKRLRLTEGVVLFSERGSGRKKEALSLGSSPARDNPEPARSPLIKGSRRRRRVIIIVMVVVVLAFAIESPFVLLVNTWGFVGKITETGPNTTLYIGCGNQQTTQTGRCASGTLVGSEVSLQLALAAVTHSSCELTSLSVYSPYRLVSVSPALPQPFGSENGTGIIVENLIHVTVQVPWIAGTYNVSSEMAVTCN